MGCRSHCNGEMSIVCTNFTFYYYSFFVDDSGGHKITPIYPERSVDVEVCSQCKVDSSTRGPAVGNDAWATKKSNV